MSAKLGISFTNRLFYMVPIFFIGRMRFYSAWLAAECSFITAAFGAYPKSCRARPGHGPTVPLENPTWDYFVILILDCVSFFKYLESSYHKDKNVFQGQEGYTRFCIKIFFNSCYRYVYRDAEKSEIEYSFETVKNINPGGSDWSSTVRDGMRNWNMTVQWWLANYVHKRWPSHLKQFRFVVKALLDVMLTDLCFMVEILSMYNFSWR